VPDTFPEGPTEAAARVLPPTEAWLIAETNRLLTGAAASIAPDGGFWWLDDRGSADRTRPRPLWITARMTHLFSLGSLLGRAQDGARADHGIDSMQGPYRDDKHGGWFNFLDPSGQAPSGQVPSAGSDPGHVDSAKAAYEHAFVLLAAASATLAGRPGADALLTQATAVMIDRFWDESVGALREGFSRDWSQLEDYRGANANMHAVEAFLVTADATGDDRWRTRALRIAELIVNVNARAHGWRIPEHFDADWRPLPEYNWELPDHPFRPYGVTPGHGLEWARLLLDLEMALTRNGSPAPTWLRAAAVALFDRAVADGWDTGIGGFVYTTGWDGVPIVRRRLHWVVAEAIGAASALAQVSGGPGEPAARRYRDAYAVFWRFAQTALIEPAGGVGWLHELDELNQPTSVTWSGRPDWYHAVQATLIPRLPLAPSLAAALARPGA